MSPPQQPLPLTVQNQFWNFVSGLVAGVISVTVCNPLDIARTRLNVLNAPEHQHNSSKYLDFGHAMRTIWKEQGWRGFYSGYRTNVVAVPIFHSLFFPIYEYVKEKAMARQQTMEKACLYATVTAGSICNIITNPIWIVRTRLMSQYLHHHKNHYKTNAPFAVIREIVKEEGYRSLFKGLGASLLSVSNAVVYFSIYEQMKKYQGSTTVWHIFVASTVAKIIASVATYPIVVVRTVMFDFRGAEQQKHLRTILRHITKENGLLGFYAGLKPDLIRLIPSNAIIFIVYQGLKQYY